MGPKSVVADRSIADQFLESLKNEDIDAAIWKTMSPFISLAVNETVKNTMKEITKSTRNCQWRIEICNRK